MLAVFQRLGPHANMPPQAIVLRGQVSERRPGGCGDRVPRGRVLSQLCVCVCGV